MVRALGALERGAITPQPQSQDGVTYAKKILKDEARIDWSKGAGEIDCQIRGLAPSPGAFTEVKGERLKILYALPVKGDSLMAASGGGAGEVISDDLTVACGEGALKLMKVQRAGKGVMEARELLKGFPLSPGTKFS
jgi:methionyl-tRNA formyltransferase